MNCYTINPLKDLTEEERTRHLKFMNDLVDEWDKEWNKGGGTEQ